MKKTITSITLGCTMLLSMGGISAQGRKYKSGYDTEFVLSIAQDLYVKQYGKRALNLSVLLEYLEDAKLTRVKVSRKLTDQEVESGMTEQKAIQNGLITADTIFVSAKDELLGKGEVHHLLAHLPNRLQ